MNEDVKGNKSSPLSALSQSACENLRVMLENPEPCSSVSSDLIPREFINNFEQVFSLSSEIIFIVSYPSGNVVYFNPVAKERMIKAGIDSSAEKITDIFSIKNSEETVISEEKNKLNVFILNNGSYDQIELRATDISRGEFSLILVYAKNISEEKKSVRLIRESEIQHRSTLNAIRDGVVVVNKDMEIVIFNDSFKSILKQTGINDDLTGKKLADVASDLTGKLGLEYRYVFKSGESLDTIIKYRNDGKLTYYEVIKSPVFDEGEVIQVVTILRDRTKNHHLEELKKEAFFQIEKNMEQFAILNDHVRNPLQVIVGLADLYGGDMGLKIISQAREINEIVTRLDVGWIESEKVRDMLSKHYGITVKRRPNVASPIGMLQTDDVYLF